MCFRAQSQLQARQQRTMSALRPVVKNAFMFVLKDGNMHKAPKQNMFRNMRSADLEEQPEDGDSTDPSLIDLIPDEPEDPTLVDLIPEEPITDEPEDPFPDEIDGPITIPPYPDKEGPDEGEPMIPEKNRCAWGPLHYCQSMDAFSTCRSSKDENQFNSECKVIRDGMLAKCEDLGKGFWCSSDTNFNYCVKSQGFDGDMSSFAACKPKRVGGGKKNCKHCGKCVTEVYNINSCGCPTPDVPDDK